MHNVCIFLPSLKQLILTINMTDESKIIILIVPVLFRTFRKLGLLNDGVLITL